LSFTKSYNQLFKIKKSSPLTAGLFNPACRAQAVNPAGRPACPA